MGGTEFTTAGRWCLHMVHKTKNCEECGQEFVPKSPTQRYCKGPHTTNCVICGQPISYTCSPKDKPKTCSMKCREVLRSSTTLSKYGVSNVSQIDEVRSKISSANSSEAVKAKRMNTCLKNWGVDNVSKSEDVRRKISKFVNSQSFVDKLKYTSLEKYGTEYPMQSQDVKQRREATCIERYGTTGHTPTASDISKVMVDGSKAEQWLMFKSGPQHFIETHYLTYPDSDKPTCSQLMKDLGVTDTPIYNVLNQHNCSNLIQHYSSSMEHEVIDFIRSNVSNIEVVHNDRTVIKPYELDIYLPDYGLGIECNPTATHNSSLVDPWGQPPKPSNYHSMKSQLANDAGIFLFHIFGYEWTHKREIIESMILNLLGCTKSKIGARSTEVCEISYNECKQFLDDNHRQGNTSSSVRLGLRSTKSNELLSVMTFGRMKSTVGRSDDRLEGCWELSRFCNKRFMSVVGGASKLLKYFIQQYEPTKIVSYSDVAHTSGNLYKVLGFTQVSKSEPGYGWVNTLDYSFLHRISAQKKNIQMLFDDVTDEQLNNMTERELMESHGYVRVFDSGVVRWELTVNNCNLK